MQVYIDVGDEKGFVEYAERVVYDLQKNFRIKEMLDGIAVIDISAKIEDLIYNEAIRECGPVPGDNVWAKKEAILWYQNKCEKIVKNLYNRDYNWKKLVVDNDARQILVNLSKEDDGSSNIVRFSNKRRSEPVAKNINKSSSQRQFQSNTVSNVDNKSKSIPKIKANYSYNNISNTNNYNQSSPSAPPIPTNLQLKLSINHGHSTNLFSEKQMIVDDTEVADILNEFDSNSYGIDGASIFIIPSSTEIKQNKISSSTSSNWNSALQERESALQREKAFQEQRGTQQEELKRQREQEIELAKQAYDEKEQQIKNIELEEETERKLKQKRLELEREKARIALEEQAAAIDLDNNFNDFMDDNNGDGDFDW